MLFRSLRAGYDNTLAIEGATIDESMILVFKKGHKISEEQKRMMKKRMTGKKNPFYGKKHSEKTMKMLRERVVSEKTRRQISLAGMGRKHSEETKRKMTGRRHTEETKRKMSKSRKGKKTGRKLSEEHKKKAPNRKGNERLWPCPEKRLEQIKEAFTHFEMI